MDASDLGAHTGCMNPLAIALSVALLAALAAGGGGSYALYQQREAFSAELASTTAAYQATSDQLASSTAAVADLSYSLEKEREKNDSFQDQIDELSGTVGKLNKLSQTDPELLDKYSKVFFLSDNYVPADLTNISKKYLYDQTRTLQFQSDAYDFLTDMLDDAQDDDVDILVASAYRSFGTQASLKAQYTVVYGTGANAFSADQGYSEHQLGTAADFTTKSLAGGLDGFDATPAYKWLTANAYKYGFILSYPQGNGYYEYEPWHWRFVGKKLARYLHTTNERFYDLDQRTIDSYLITIFDK